MAGCIATIDNRNKGRCKKCTFTHKEKNGLGNDCLWCEWYDNWCMRVAWNCNAPPEGRRFMDLLGG
jgi:hypothetical protein